MSVGLRGTVSVSKEDKVSEDAINRRLDVLEDFLWGHAKTKAVGEAAAQGTLSERAAKLDHELDTKENHNIKIFRIGLVDIGPRLGPWAKPVVAPDSVPLPVKKKTIWSEKKDLLKTCSQLEEITKLQGYMNASYLNEMPVYLERVAKLEANYVDIAQQAGAYQAKLEKVLKDYNELVDLLSLKAAEWHSKLSALEEKVGV